MSAAEKIEPKMITEPLTWPQICERYPDQWVCVVEIVWDETRDFPFRQARVVGHGKTRSEPLDQAKRWLDQYTSIGHFRTRESQSPIPRLFL